MVLYAPLKLVGASPTKFNKVQQSSTKPKDIKKHMWQSCDSRETIFSRPPLQGVPSREQEGEGDGGGGVEEEGWRGRGGGGGVEGEGWRGGGN